MGKFRKMHNNAEEVSASVISLWQSGEQTVNHLNSKKSKQQIALSILKMATGLLTSTASLAALVFTGGFSFPFSIPLLLLGISLFNRGLKRYNKVFL